jgi:hypothetical protein
MDWHPAKTQNNLTLNPPVALGVPPLADMVFKSLMASASKILRKFPLPDLLLV